MVKSIIRRIIAGIGIMVAWYFIDTNFLMVVNAQSINVNPDTLCAINNNGDTCNMSNVGTYTIYERPMYGNTFGNNNYRGRIVWHFSGSNLSGKTYDLTFLVYTSGGTQYDYPNRGYIQNSDNNLYSCQIDNTKLNQNNTQNTSMTGTATVTCNNVYMSGNWGFFYLVDINTVTNGVVAISPLTFSESVSAKQAQELEEINDNITDDSVDNSKATDDIDDMKDKVASNGTITQLLTLPITFYQELINSIGGTCQSVSLGSLLGTNLTLPCINLASVLGQTIWSFIDAVFCFFFAFSLRKKMVDIFNHITSLQDRGNEFE